MDGYEKLFKTIQNLMLVHKLMWNRSVSGSTFISSPSFFLVLIVPVISVTQSNFLNPYNFENFNFSDFMDLCEVVISIASNLVDGMIHFWIFQFDRVDQWLFSYRG